MKYEVLISHMVVQISKIDGDCLPDGTFDTRPRAIVQGDACLRDGTAMYKCVAEIKNVCGNFLNLSMAHSMFSGCSSLSSFNGSLPALTNGESMFNNCRSLKSWSENLPSLINGDEMFRACRALSTFDGELTALTKGAAMFPLLPIIEHI